MPRKPNYKFERLERQKAKAAKKAARLEAKMEKSDKRKTDDDGLTPVDGDTAAPSESDDMARLNELLNREK